MKIVSNASPLIHLSRIGHLSLLKSLYGEIWIADAVWQEVVIQGDSQPGALMVSKANWIRRSSITNQILLTSLRQDLDIGEAESIVLSLEMQANRLLMDERLGRNAAAQLGITCLGVVGILIAAKQIKLINSVTELLDMLRYQSGFYLKEDLYKRIQKDCGEILGDD